MPLPEHHAENGDGRYYAQYRRQDHDEQEEEVEQRTHGLSDRATNSNVGILSHGHSGVKHKW
jgi:hypothetical protein